MVMIVSVIACKAMSTQLMAHQNRKIVTVASLKKEALNRLKQAQSQKAVAERNKSALESKKGKLEKKGAKAEEGTGRGKEGRIRLPPAR